MTLFVLNMADLPTLKKNRGVLKAQITSFAKFIKSLENPNDVEKINVKKRLDKIEGIIDQFQEIQNNINVLDTDEENNMREREQFEDDYYEIIAIATNLIKDEIIDEANSDNNSNRSQSHPTCLSAVVRRLMLNCQKLNCRNLTAITQHGNNFMIVLLQ